MQVLANKDFNDWARQRQMHMETVLDRILPAPDLAPQRLHQAMRYAALDGGKRVRPLLAFAAGELTNAAAERVEAAAAAVELIHVYSLVHDDLPCMDNDELRRGKPTCHVAFDEATALLVGDSLQSLAFQLIAERTVTHSPSIQLELIRLLALASGSRGMAGGQAIDLESVGKTLTQTELEFMHIHKTGALIRAAVLLGAHAGNGLDSSQLDAINHYATCIGLAFQVMDDILDVEASTATLGKTAGKDAEQNKPTYVSILGLEAARKLAQDLHHNALSALIEFGDSAKRLAQIADFVVQRQS
jgi:farnesyl diphosphate synthase